MSAAHRFTRLGGRLARTSVRAASAGVLVAAGLFTIGTFAEVFRALPPPERPELVESQPSVQLVGEVPAEAPWRELSLALGVAGESQFLNGPAYLLPMPAGTAILTTRQDEARRTIMQLVQCPDVVDALPERWRSNGWTVTTAADGAWKCRRAGEEIAAVVCGDRKSLILSRASLLPEKDP